MILIWCSFLLCKWSIRWDQSDCTSWRKQQSAVKHDALYWLRIRKQKLSILVFDSSENRTYNFPHWVHYRGGPYLIWYLDLLFTLRKYGHILAHIYVMICIQLLHTLYIIIILTAIFTLIHMYIQWDRYIVWLSLA